MIGLLIARPLRVRTFTAIKIDQHLLPHREGFLLRFAPEDIKDRRSRDYLLHAELVVPMQTYLTVHRPALLQGNDSDFLWISRRGTPLGIDSFTAHLANLTHRAFGETLRPHAFRHIAATTIATEDPDNASIIAPVLGHASLRMSEKHYNRARGVEAASAYQEIVAGVRTEARRRSRNRNRANRRAHRSSHSQSDMED